jgi:hypothetical protein
MKSYKGGLGRNQARPLVKTLIVDRVLHSTFTSCHRHVHVAWYFLSQSTKCLVWDHSHWAKGSSTRRMPNSYSSSSCNRKLGFMLHKRCVLTNTGQKLHTHTTCPQAPLTGPSTNSQAQPGHNRTQSLSATTCTNF